MLRKLRLAWLALNELGFSQVFLYGLYRLGMITGYFRWRTPVTKKKKDHRVYQFRPIFTIPSQDWLASLANQDRAAIIKEADEIVQGQVRLFGGDARPLNLVPQYAGQHWTKTKANLSEDIKLTWEPARFGWVFLLGRAYQIARDERFSQTFWQFWEQFTAANPVNRGSNWQSGQEVALRLVAYLYAAQVFENSSASTPERRDALLDAVAGHAERIQPTLVYARSQHNNHLISEACGLYLAGTAIPDHPKAETWRRRGWHWLERAFLSQIDADGTHAQHSMNYHRMVLHLALLGQLAARINGKDYAEPVQSRLAAATRWMMAQLDESGDAPNLGNNDGANILLLGPAEFRDHRPTAQAAAAAFLHERYLSSGAWDEMAAWLGISIPDKKLLETSIVSPAVRRLGNEHEWATLRAVNYRSRPAHADQLHVDLWFHGINILMDPGTMAYNQPPTWENSLVFSRFHNTITVDGLDPMLRVGKFLWLQWDQARWIESECKPAEQLAAEHSGYVKSGIRHRRILRRDATREWLVQDIITLKAQSAEHEFLLQWLLPNGEVSVKDQEVTLRSGPVVVTLEIKAETGSVRLPAEIRIVRGGKLIVGSGTAPTNEGWYSPTYLSAIPANSLQATFRSSASLMISTRLTIQSSID